MHGSKRIKEFREDVAKRVPRFPNNGNALKVLKAKSLGSLLVDYANWAIRNVPPRPRTVVTEPSATSDSRWQSLSTHIQALLDKARRGDDLDAYLSTRRRRGFTPKASQSGGDIWSDKDMLLNVTGYHHFHLHAVPRRSDDVLFVHVTRDTFTVVRIFRPLSLQGPSIQPSLWKRRETAYGSYLSNVLPAGFHRVRSLSRQ